MSYQLLAVGVKRLSDNLVIKRDMAEWAEYRVWLKEGNEPLPMEVPAPPVIPLDQAVADVKYRITLKRDGVQYGGAVIGGMPVKTDRDSIALLDQALSFSGRNPQRTFKVKTSTGVHVPMTAAQIGGLFDALGERVAACWDAEATHYAAVNAIVAGAGTDEEKAVTVMAYDFSAGWPE